MSPVRRVPLPEPGDLELAIPAVDGAQAGITTAAAGDMRGSREHSHPARAAFLGRHGIRRENLYVLRQVHSLRVEVIDGQSAAETAMCEADGMVSVRQDVVLSVTVADCLPIFLVDTRSMAFAVVHSGWRGTGIVAEALQIMEARFGCRPDRVAAVIGPGIGVCCYTVPPDRAAQFVSRYGPSTVVQDGGVPRLDLRAANLVILQEAGVRDITVISDCTSCSPALGSFRRQGPSEYTLMLAWIRRQPTGRSTGGTQ